MSDSAEITDSQLADLSATVTEQAKEIDELRLVQAWTRGESIPIEKCPDWWWAYIAKQSAAINGNATAAVIQNEAAAALAQRAEAAEASLAALEPRFRDALTGQLEHYAIKVAVKVLHGVLKTTPATSREEASTEGHAATPSASAAPKSHSQSEILPAPSAPEEKTA